MKLTTSSDLSEESLQFASQLGVTHLRVAAGQLMDEHQSGPVQVLHAQKRWSAATGDGPIASPGIMKSETSGSCQKTRSEKSV